jgi:plasmid stabilization system protein ParE
MKIAYSSRAVADIASIADYLSERNPQGARAVERRIREVLDHLAEFPGMGLELAQRPKVRVMPLGRYPNLIFYTAREGELIVLHIRHGSRKPLKSDEL